VIDGEGGQDLCSFLVIRRGFAGSWSDLRQAFRDEQDEVDHKSVGGAYTVVVVSTLDPLNMEYHPYP
jgi:hypothetical protein